MLYTGYSYDCRGGLDLLLHAVSLLLSTTSILHLVLNSLLTRLIHNLSHATRTLCKLGTLATNKVPRKVEHLVERFERLSRSLGQEEVHPDETDSGDAGEEQHSASVGHGNEHERYSLGVTVLVDKVECHGDGTTERTETERVDLGVDEVLDRVPSERPTETGEVDHDDGTHGSVLLA